MTTESYKKDAFISECGLYRYWLTRTWDESLPRLTFVMLNPSVADANIDDPTIRRCVGFARRDGYGGITVINLFAYRATDPKELENAARGIDIEGLRNAFYHGYFLGDAKLTSSPIVCAWGANKAVGNSGNTFIDYARSKEVELVCLGQTKSGAPKHPLYISADQPLVSFDLS